MGPRVLELVVALLPLLLLHDVLANAEPGWLEPVKVEQLIGSDFNISCTINQTYLREMNISSEQCSVKMLFFESKSIKYRNIPDIRQLNDTTILFSARNASEQDQDYSCMCGDYVINTSKVYVGTRPMPIKDFGCIAYDFEYMVCNFTEPHNRIITKYNVTFTTEKEAHYIYPVECNFDAAPVVTCNITNELYKRFNEFYYFRLHMFNALGQVEQEITVNHYERSVPARPGQNISKVNVTESSICLSWDMPRRTTYDRGLAWLVYVAPQNFSPLQRDYWRNNSSTIKDFLCLTELPFAGYNYTLHLQVRINLKNTMWSEPLVYEFATAPARPRRPPRVTYGSFYVYSSETNLSFFWEPLEPQELNGPDFRYVISEFRVNGSLMDPNLIQVFSNSALIEGWKQNAHYEILIRSSNSMGASVNATRMSIGPISAEDFRVRVPKNIRSVYHSSNNSYTLSWEPPEDLYDLTNYTVFWCVPKPGLLSECEGSIRFAEVAYGQQLFTTAKNQLPTLHMAVSANYRTHNTGLRWLICSSDKKDDLVKMEPSIDAASNSSLTVKWSTERVCPVILAGYNLTYCQRSTGRPDNCTTEVIHDRDARQHVIRDLVPYTDYSVKMLMFSESRASKYSDELVNRTGEAAPSQPRELHVLRVDSSSVRLAWKPPLRANGVVRTYEGTFRSLESDYSIVEDFRVAASAGELVEKEKFIAFTLANLTAFTRYEVTVRAKTLYPSEPSNLVEFVTAIGVPSSPSLFVTNNKDQTSRLDWSRPRIPAGRIDYYEISVRDNNESCLTSLILSGKNRSYVMPTPRCTSHNPFQLAVRAINVEQLPPQLQQQLEAGLEATTLMAGLSLQSSQSCDPRTDALGEEEQDRFREYGANASAYQLHRSEWGTYGFICTPDTHSLKAMYQTIEVCVAILVLGVIFYLVYKKYRKMSDIGLVLPPGILETLKKNELGGLGQGMTPDLSSGGIVCTMVGDSPQYTSQDLPHDFGSCGSESSKLLRRTGSSSGGGGCADRDIYVDHPESGPISGTAPPASYVAMRHGLLMQERERGQEREREREREQERARELQQQQGEEDTEKQGREQGGGGNGYIKPTQMKNWAGNGHFPANPMPMPMPMAPPRVPISGYVPVPIVQSRPSPTLAPMPSAALAPASGPGPGSVPAPAPVSGTALNLAPAPALSTAAATATAASTFFPPAHLLTDNYVQASDLHKLKPLATATASAAGGAGAGPATVAGTLPPMAPIRQLPPATPAGPPKLAADIGYTTMEQLQLTGLMKPPLPHAMGSPSHPAGIGEAAVGNPGNPGSMPQHSRLQPQINGYVTPQDLNALAHNRHVL
ncbi:hypothetical protein KR067_002998 [Drosophila pandora]|nr:hypothetical protein KR067_002998 [Drosophila pandora]